MMTHLLLRDEFADRRELSVDELLELEQVAVIFEREHVDSDGARGYVYTVAGFLDGQNVATANGGCTVGGDVIITHGRDRKEADAIACGGLQETIVALVRQRYESKANMGIGIDGYRRSVN